MTAALPRPDDTARAPEAFRAGLAELFEIGMSVARMVRATAEAETALAETTAKARAATDATSLAEAIELDRALAEANEPRLAAVERTEAIAAAYNQVARAVRRTALLAERFDRGWARRGGSDDSHAMAKRQIARGVAEALDRETSRERIDQLTDALAEAPDAPETPDDIGNQPDEDLYDDIQRELDRVQDGDALSTFPRHRERSAAIQATGPTRGDTGSRHAGDEGAIQGSAPNPAEPADATCAEAGPRGTAPAGPVSRASLTPSSARPPPDRTSPHR